MRENEEAFCSSFLSLLVDEEERTAVAGSYSYCSVGCRGEKDQHGHRLLDESRFKLSCGHFSMHLQCIATYAPQGSIGGYGICPIGDSQKCKWYDGADARSGDHFFWGENEFHDFFRAFLRNEKLVKAFVKPQLLSPEGKSEFEVWASKVRKL